MTRRYPLEALKDVRRSAVDGHVREVAERAAATGEASREEERARSLRQAEEDAARAALEAERARVERGTARAVDLQAELAWEQAERARLAGLRQAEERRREATRRAAGLEQTARAELARAEADAKAVEEHRQRWHAEGERKRELEQEDAVQDGWAARNPGPGRRA